MGVVTFQGLTPLPFPDTLTFSLLGIVSDWQEFLLHTIENEEIEKMRRHERAGRPLGSEAFIEKLESFLDRALKRRKPGPKKKESD